MRTVWFILLCFIEFCTTQGPPPEEKEYAFNFVSPPYVCEDQVSHQFIDTSDMGVYRHNETSSYIVGEIKMLKEMDSCIQIEVTVEKTTGSRTEVMATHDICNLCNEMTSESDYHTYLKNLGFPETCPIKPGNYRVDNWVMDSKDLPCTAANEASYQVTLKFYKNPTCDCEKQILLGCIKIGFNIELV